MPSEFGTVYYKFEMVIYSVVLFLYAVMSYVIFFGVLDLLVLREQREHVKDLSCLSRSFCRTVLVDNNPFSFLLQPLNGIPCIPFYAGQPNDNQVLAICMSIFFQYSSQCIWYFIWYFFLPFFSLWRLFFPSWSICLWRKMFGLFFTKGFTCQNGLRNKESPCLIGCMILLAVIENLRVEIRGFSGFCDLSLLVNYFELNILIQNSVQEFDDQEFIERRVRARAPTADCWWQIFTLIV